jgi:hypothetical protein
MKKVGLVHEMHDRFLRIILHRVFYLRLLNVPLVEFWKNTIPAEVKDRFEFREFVLWPRA